MPNWLHNALFYAIAAIVQLALAAIPFGLAMTAGMAWAIILTLLLAWLIGWLAGRAGPGGAAIVVPSFAGLVLGLIGAGLFKLYGFVMAVLS